MQLHVGILSIQIEGSHMKKVKYFYLKVCPYCLQADKWLKELIKENPSYASIEIERIEESKHQDISKQYDYYYVPTFYVNEEKLHEGVPTKEKIRSVLEASL